MTKITRAVLASTLAILTASPSLAHGDKACTTEPQDKWKPQTEAEAAAKAAGYEVKKSKIEGTCYEVYGVDKSGKLFEVFYNPVDLALVKTEEKLLKRLCVESLDPRRECLRSKTSGGATCGLGPRNWPRKCTDRCSVKKRSAD